MREYPNADCAVLEGQDGGVGRYTLPPDTTKRRTTTNFKTKNNQSCQKIELHGSPTTKELKKKCSSRLVGGAAGVEKTRSKTAAREPGWARHSWWSGQSHIHLQINQEEQLGSKTDHTTQGSNVGKRRPQNLRLKKAVGFAAAGETPSLTGEFTGETHRVL